MINLAIVDDHNLFRKGLIQILKDNEQFNILFDANSGNEFFNKLNPKQLPDIVVLDLNMPGFDGFEVQKTIKEKFKTVKTLILSMHDEIDYVGYLFELDINGYVLKEADPEELEQAIITIHNEGYYFDKFSTSAIQHRLKSKRRNNPKIAVDGLSAREIEVLLLLCEEKTTKEIADLLFLSPRTIDDYRNSLYQKTSAKNVAGLLKYAIRKKLFEIDSE